MTLIGTFTREAGENAALGPGQDHYGAFHDLVGLSAGLGPLAAGGELPGDHSLQRVIQGSQINNVRASDRLTRDVNSQNPPPGSPPLTRASASGATPPSAVPSSTNSTSSGSAPVPSPTASTRCPPSAGPASPTTDPSRKKDDARAPPPRRGTRTLPGRPDLQDSPRRRRRLPSPGVPAHAGAVGRCPADGCSPGPDPGSPHAGRAPPHPGRPHQRRRGLQPSPQPSLPEKTPH